MKLIIDVPIEELTPKAFFDYFEVMSTKLSETLMNGTPYEERPQGEWIYHSDGYIAFYTCNRCNCFGDIDDKFCSHCGANMKGGAE